MGEDRCITVYSPNPELAERIVAEVYAAGASGVLEEPEDDLTRLTIYLASEQEPAILDRLRELSDEGVEIGSFADIEDRVWSETWKEGHKAIEVSPRLRVRPPFLTAEVSAGQHEIVIDPGQAFGTGQHESTQLALQALDELLLEEPQGASNLLDIGTGSGILAMAARRLGVEWALGFDLHKVAVFEARRHAEVNRLERGIDFFAGPIAALRNRRFDLVVVNMLRSEMLPIASEISACVGRKLVLAGLLETDRATTLERFGAEGLILESDRELRDESGNRWIGLCLTWP